MNEQLPTARPHDPDLPLIACQTVGRQWLTRAPVRYVSTVELPVSAAQLFAIFEDPDSWPKWAMGIGNVEWTCQKPFRPGTTRTVTFWGGLKVYEDFFLYDAPREMAFYFYGTTELVWHAFAEHYKVEPLGAHRCRLQWTVAYDPAGLFGKLHFAIRPLMALNFRWYMWRLRRHCAAAARHTD